MEHFIEDETPSPPTLWERIRSFFKSSETIAWARFNVVFGFAATALTFVDPNLVAGLLPPQWVGGFFLINGVCVEYLRRRRAPNLGEQQ